ncbi:Coronatine-insensitive protein 1 [Turnera subulata]|uniref:Coronatine-insensitive protein 1 n=1 Tax=Turnera subulata TaxID=218843 RepID=A0A9Q0GH97_9ROSI|nr:Coronatine-insensitive protein 1 [Turnera subulata]
MEESNNHRSRVNYHGSSVVAMPDVVLECVLPYVDDPRDRGAISLVSRRWCELDALTRKHVTIAMCYTASPERLRRRFSHLESLKLKGKPRAAMFYNLIPDDWGGFVTPWVAELVGPDFTNLKSLHFRRMIVRDSDLELLAKAKGKALHALKLDKCSGFSTDGLLHVGRFCRQLRTLFLEDSSIIENDGDWLHELAMNNTVLENLNFYATDLNEIRFEDLELIARNCRSLVSVKITDCEILDLLGFFRAATGLEEFCGGVISDYQSSNYPNSIFPQTLCRVGINYVRKDEMPILFPFASLLKKLDLLYAMLDTEGHCLLIQKCPNLEVLEARNVIGDRGLEVLACSCKRLKRLRIERGADDHGREDEEGIVSQRGLIALAQGCLELEYLAVYVSDITNAALEYMGTYSKNLNDFRLVLLEHEERITDLPLDNGVRALLTGCTKLERLALYLRQGGLTDIGLGYVGQYSENVRWMLLGSVGESDEGLLAFARGCPHLQKLEMRACCFSEIGIARAVMQLPSLRYVWVQGYRETSTGHHDLLTMARPYWNIELIPARQVENEHGVFDNPAHMLAYYSLDGPRTDFPDTVTPLHPLKLVDAQNNGLPILEY